MMNKKSKKSAVEVTILGQHLSLRADDDPERIQRIAAYINRKVDELSSKGPVSSQKLAVLAALNIADDYFRILDEAKEFKHQVATKSRAMLLEIDS
ncbi:cell division protein ZapA [Myxococcota bacterium]|nr:cell division protein ZapA [Myxococcota bacterium]